MQSIPPIFVISLARATERRTDIIGRLEAANIRYEIVDAVDGAALDLSQIADRYNEKSAITKGEIGCYLSHYNLWERIVAEDIPYAVILEDDAQWDEDFMQVAAAVAACEWQWDVVLLQGGGMRRRYRVLSQLGNGREMVQYGRHVVCTGGYLVSCGGAKKLLAHCRNIAEPIDLAWRDYWNWRGGFYAVRPFCVHCPIGSPDSLINPSEEKREMKRGARTYFYRLWDAAMRRLYARLYPPKKKKIP